MIFLAKMAFGLFIIGTVILMLIGSYKIVTSLAKQILT